MWSFGIRPLLGQDTSVHSLDLSGRSKIFKCDLMAYLNAGKERQSLCQKVRKEKL